MTCFQVEIYLVTLQEDILLQVSDEWERIFSYG